MTKDEATKVGAAEVIVNRKLTIDELTLILGGHKRIEKMEEALNTLKKIRSECDTPDYLVLMRVREIAREALED